MDDGSSGQQTIQMQMLKLMRTGFDRIGAAVMHGALAMLAGLSVAWQAGVPAGGAPPANDTCAGAVVIPAGSYPYLTAVLTNVNEAQLTGDPLPGCIAGAQRGVWYRFTPAESGTYTLSTGADTATTAFDTIMSVFAAPTCGTMTNEVACNDDLGGSNNRAGLQVDLAAGTNYFILVWLSGADSPSEALSLQLRVDRPRPPANDTCATAEEIPANLGFPRKSSTNDTILAGTDASQPTCAAGYRGVWYKFTPAVTGTYILSTGNDTATAIYDSVMALYTGNECGSLTPTTCSDGGEGRGSILRILNGGTTYYIAVHDESPEAIVSETLVQLSVSVPTAPSVTTHSLVSIASTGAVLSATVNPNGLQSRFWFEWGPGTSFSSNSRAPVLLAGTLPVTSNVVVTGFAADTLHRFRAVATNIVGRADGAAQTFLWSSTRPTLQPLERLLSGNVRLWFNGGNSRQIYVMETSTNLVNWTVLGEAVESPAGSGTFTYTHVGAGAAQRRFYRVSVP